MPLWFQTALLPRGWIEGVRLHLAGGSIGRVGTGVEANSDDERHAIAIPGLCNVHSHGVQRGMAGGGGIGGPSGGNFLGGGEVVYLFLDGIGTGQGGGGAYRSYFGE